MADLESLPANYTVADLCEWLGIENERYVKERIVKEGWPHIFIDRKHRFTAEHMLAIRDLHERGTGSTKVSFAGQVTRRGRTA